MRKSYSSFQKTSVTVSAKPFGRLKTQKETFIAFSVTALFVVYADISKQYLLIKKLD